MRILPTKSDQKRAITKPYCSIQTASKTQNISKLKIGQMAKTARKRKIEARNRKDEKRIFMVIAVATIVIIFLMYLSFSA